jgi:hypothetical protein
MVGLAMNKCLPLRANPGVGCRRISGQSSSSSMAIQRMRAHEHDGRALASVATHTEAAPAWTSACAAARAVAPVVKMSSITRMCFDVDSSRIGDRKAPRGHSSAAGGR